MIKDTYNKSIKIITLQVFNKEWWGNSKNGHKRAICCLL